MKNLQIIAITCSLCAALFQSCSMQPSSLPDVRGKQGEIIMVIPRTVWESKTGDTIRHYLSYPIDGLPAPEPVFTVLQQEVLTDFTRQVRNIIMVDINMAYDSTTLSYQSDVYAKGQLIFYIKAPVADSVASCVKHYGEVIIKHYLAADRKGYLDYYSRINSEALAEKVLKQYHIGMIIPKEYTLAVDKPDFLWFAREERDMIMGILMWQEPYTSTAQLQAQHLINKINTMTKKYVPGPADGTYMTTEAAMPPVVTTDTTGGVYAVQLNGLWKTENYYMGGPYVSRSVIDMQSGQLVTAVGFVFFPRKNKRDYVRQLEAILSTMKPDKTPLTKLVVPIYPERYFRSIVLR